LPLEVLLGAPRCGAPDALPVDGSEREIAAAQARYWAGIQNELTGAASFDAAAFVTLCRFDLPDIRAELVKLEAAWRACVDDLEGVGVLRPGHVPPEGVANVEACMPGLRASIHLLDVMIAKLGPAVGSGEPGT
jgi:hypothetical protein